MYFVLKLLLHVRSVLIILSRDYVTQINTPTPPVDDARCFSLISSGMSLLSVRVLLSFTSSQLYKMLTFWYHSNNTEIVCKVVYITLDLVAKCLGATHDWRTLSESDLLLAIPPPVNEHLKFYDIRIIWHQRKTISFSLKAEHISPLSIHYLDCN